MTIRLYERKTAIIFHLTILILIIFSISVFYGEFTSTMIVLFSGIIIREFLDRQQAAILVSKNKLLIRKRRSGHSITLKKSEIEKITPWRIILKSKKNIYFEAFSYKKKTKKKLKNI